MTTGLELTNNVQEFTPLPKQEVFMYQTFINDLAKFIWYCGGFGSGKSYIGAQAVIRLGMSAPKGRGLIGRNTLVDLKASTMKTFFEVCDPRLILKFNKSENLATLINGHEIYFWGLDDIEKLKSFEIGWFWFDEVDEVQQRAFEVAQGRLRHKAQPKRLGIITSNSEGKNWTYKKFIRGDGVRSKIDMAKYYTIKAPSNENTNLPEDYLDVLNSYTGDLYDRYVQASFDVFEGQIFPEFNKEIHVIEPFAVPSEWERIRCGDHGERNPTAVLWLAIHPDTKAIYVYLEHYEAGQFVPYHAKQVAEMSEGEYYGYTVFDPSIKSTRGSTGKKVDKEWRDEMRSYEPDFRLKFGVNNVNAGIARMHRYLTIDKDQTHPITKKVGASNLYIFNTCVHLLDEIESYKWNKQSRTSENDPDEKPRKKDDHAVDALRYGIMSRPLQELTGSIHSNNNGNRLALKPSKRDQVLSEDEIYLENMKKLHPEEFIL